MGVEIEYNVDVTYLFELNLCQESVQVNLAKVNLADCWRSCSFLDWLFRINDVNDRVESHELIDLLQHHLRSLVTTYVPYADNLCVGTIAASHLFELEACCGIGRPVLLLEDQLV